MADVDQTDGEHGQQSSLMADIDQSDGEDELVVVAGGALAAPYVASKKRKRAAAATIHENEPGLHAFARACFGRLQAPLPSRIALPAPLDARTAAGEAVAAAVARRGDSSREPLRPVNKTYTLDEVVDRVLQGPSARFDVEAVGACALPRDGATLLADVSRWAELLPRTDYTCIVADPPWPSRSAARRGAYDTARDAWRAPLRRLPVASLAASSGAVVAVWVTNDRKVADWVARTLFRAWGVRHVGTWYWLKCASDGSPVLPLDEHAERKPWEPLVVGVVNAAGGVEGDAWAPRGASWLRRVPVRRAVASVPGSHSAKPRLDAALAPCFRAGAPPFRGLELFGRGAFAGWTVAGDQALPLAGADA